MAREPDPRSELAALQAALSSGEPPRGVVLRGAERYFLARALRAAREACRAAGHELCDHDAAGPDFDAARVMDDLVGGALFAARRCVVVENAEERLKKDAPLARGVLSFLNGDRGTVVLAGKSLRADNAVVKAIKKLGGPVLSFRRLYDSPGPWEKFPDPRNTELVGWVVARARELKLPLSPDRAVLLTKRAGTELEAIDQALTMLAAGDGELESLGSEAAAGAPFQVADDLVAGNTGPALAGIETLFRGGMRKERDGTREQGTDALIAILMGTVRGRLRESLLVAEALEREGSLDGALKTLGMKPAPFVRRRLEDLVGVRTAAGWRRMLEDALALERRGRSGGTVDAADLSALALRWRRPRPPAAQGSGPKARASRGPRG
jgi:DNA polymerase III delta subunit